jgi:hypothetical protein
MLWEGMVGGELAAAEVQQETKGSTALKALATHKSSHCIVQSANLLHQLRKSSSHSEQVSGSLSLSLSLFACLIFVCSAGFETWGLKG